MNETAPPHICLISYHCGERTIVHHLDELAAAAAAALDDGAGAVERYLRHRRTGQE